MDASLKELLVSRIISGCLRCKINNKVYYLKQPSRLHRYKASEIYYDTFQECLSDGLYTDDELLEFMTSHGFWDLERQLLYERAPKDIEDFKVNLFKATFDEGQRTAIRRVLNNARDKYATLSDERTKFNHLSARGTALIAKSRYLIGISLWRSNGRKYFTSKDFWESSDPILNHIANFLIKNAISEAQYREVARTEPWQTCYRIDKTLGIPAVDMSEEQRTLLAWSGLYTNLESHPNCPSKRVIEDNDMLDGWLIEQRRKYESDLDKQEGEDFIKNDAIRNSEEIYIMAKSSEDARRIHELNDDYGLMMKKMKLDCVKEKGAVEEKDMPDQRMRKLEQMAKMR